MNNIIKTVIDFEDGLAGVLVSIIGLMHTTSFGDLKRLGLV